MKVLLITALLLVAAAAGWRHRAAALDWLAAAPAMPARPIAFDNGTVREPAPPAPRALASAVREGGLRKCVRASQTTYTNFDCPPGFREKGVSSDRVTVLEGQAFGGKTAAPAAPGAGSQGARRRLHDALDLGADDKLRERMMERAIDAGSR